MSEDEVVEVVEVIERVIGWLFIITGSDEEVIGFDRGSDEGSQESDQASDQDEIKEVWSR